MQQWTKTQRKQQVNGNNGTDDGKRMVPKQHSNKMSIPPALLKSKSMIPHRRRARHRNRLQQRRTVAIEIMTIEVATDFKNKSA
jgi:hypothetical protein